MASNAITVKLLIWRQSGPAAPGKLVPFTMDNVLPEMSFLEIREELLPLLRDEDETVRIDALRCFGKRRDLAAGPIILELLRNGQAEKHEVAVCQAMGSLCGPALNHKIHHYWWHHKPDGDRTAIEKAIASFEAWLNEQ